jgi:DUF4097 and DUF4098 domain-containing protein YvlB
MKETFATPGRVVLDIRLPDGQIAVETADTEETTVELTGLADSELAELARIDLRERGDRYEVRVEVDERRGFGFRFLSRESFRLDVRVPHGADLRLATASADVRGRGRFGSVDVKGRSGDLAVEDVEGDVDVKSASGDVLARRVGGAAEVQTASGDVEIGAVAGAAKVRSASGDVTIREAGSEVVVQTASGDQRVDSVAQGAVTLQSASGDIEVGIARGSTLWVDARSLSGDATSDLEVGEAPPEGGDGPRVELRATSMSGDIHVARAPAQAELTG